MNLHVFSPCNTKIASIHNKLLSLPSARDSYIVARIIIDHKEDTVTSLDVNKHIMVMTSLAQSALTARTRSSKFSYQECLQFTSITHVN